MKKTVFLFFLCSFLTITGQDKALIDSLIVELQNVKEDTIKAKLLNDISWEYNQGNPQKALVYADELLNFSKSINYQWGIAAAYSDMAFSYEYQGNYSEALKYRLMDLKVNEKYGSKASIARTYNNLGNIYNRMKDYDKALEFYYKKIAIVNTTDNLKMKRSLGSTYSNIALTYRDKKILDSALKYIFVARDIAVNNKDNDLLTNIYINVGIIFNDLNKGADALEYYKKALSLALENDFKRRCPLILSGMGDAYLNKEMYDEAISSAQQALEYARLTSQRNQELDAYELFAKIYDRKKEYQQKSDYLEKYIKLKDSLVNDEQASQLYSLKVQFETEEKEKENLILTNKNQVQSLMLTGAAALFVFVLIVGWLLFRQNKLRAQRESMQLEQQLLRSQMNPHFIFNSLIAIESFIYSNEPKTAGKYLSGFARLMRLILENSRQETVTLFKEIESLENYLQLQQLRYDNAFDYSLTVSPELETDFVEVPPMLAQPFIENAIEHGLRDVKQGGLIEIHFSKKDGNLLLEIKDNGTGIQQKAGAGHQSLATTITRERIALFNKKNKQKASFSITDAYPLQERKGVLVLFVLPVL